MIGKRSFIIKRYKFISIYHEYFFRNFKIIKTNNLIKIYGKYIIIIIESYNNYDIMIIE